MNCDLKVLKTKLSMIDSDEEYLQRCEKIIQAFVNAFECEITSDNNDRVSISNQYLLALVQGAMGERKNISFKKDYLKEFAN